MEGVWCHQNGNTGCSRFPSPSQELTTIHGQDTTEKVGREEYIGGKVVWKNIACSEKLYKYSCMAWHRVNLEIRGF